MQKGNDFADKYYESSEGHNYVKQTNDKVPDDYFLNPVYECLELFIDAVEDSY